ETATAAAGRRAGRRHGAADGGAESARHRTDIAADTRAVPAAAVPGRLVAAPVGLADRREHARELLGPLLLHAERKGERQVGL
ncbi:hypothetical protein DF186_21960, partial [Enterococcus hirae]